MAPPRIPSRWIGVASVLFSLALAESVFLFLERKGALQGFMHVNQRIVFVLVLAGSALLTYFLGLLLRSFLVSRTKSGEVTSLTSDQKSSSDQLRILGEHQVAFDETPYPSKVTPQLDSPKVLSADWSQPPEQTIIDVQRTEHAIAIRVRGLGLLRGPAVPFTGLGIIFGVIALIATPISILRNAYGDTAGLTILWAVAILFGIIGLWRGKLTTLFELGDANLRVTRLSPFAGKYSSRDFVRARIRKIQATWLKAKNTIAPTLAGLQIEDAEGIRHVYLRGYPMESVQWIADVLTGQDKGTFLGQDKGTFLILN